MERMAKSLCVRIRAETNEEDIMLVIFYGYQIKRKRVKLCLKDLKKP